MMWPLGAAVSSKLRKRCWSRLLTPSGLLAFWIGLVNAGRHYPGGYDWPYTTISSLVYAERNPAGFLWARGGLLLCGVLGLCWTVQLLRGRRIPRAGGSGSGGIWTLAIGYLCMSGCALLPERWHLPRGHDALALAAFLSLAIGSVIATFSALAAERSQRCLFGNGSVNTEVFAQVQPWPPLPAAVLSAAVLAPILGAAIAQTYVSHALPALPWVSPLWRARGVPAYLSFAFWEWITCAVLTLQLTLLSYSLMRARP